MTPDPSILVWVNRIFLTIAGYRFFISGELLSAIDIYQCIDYLIMQYFFLIFRDKIFLKHKLVSRPGFKSPVTAKYL